MAEELRFQLEMKRLELKAEERREARRLDIEAASEARTLELEGWRWRRKKRRRIEILNWKDLKLVQTKLIREEEKERGTRLSARCYRACSSFPNLISRRWQNGLGDLRRWRLRLDGRKKEGLASWPVS